MPHTQECPYQQVAETVTGHLETLKKDLSSKVNDLSEHAAEMNRIATKDPLVTLEPDFALEEVNQLTVRYNSNLDELETISSEFAETVSMPCPGALICAAECVKRTAMVEAGAAVQALNDQS